jgi:hypothetical protein
VTLRLTSSGGADISSPIANASGQTTGTLTGDVTLSTATTGHYSFEIWVVDGAGDSSNHLVGSFDVLPNIGAAWTQQVSSTTADLSRVAWSGSLFAAVGAAGTIVTSPDGVVWTSADSRTTNALNGIAWIGSRFVAVGEQGTILTSADGTTWTQSTVGRSDISLTAVAGSQSLLVVVGGNLVMTSTDGVTWVERVSAAPAWVFNGVASSGSRFVAVGWNTQSGSGPVTIWSSTDGVSWSSQDVSNSVQPYLFEVIWSGSQFVAVGRGTVAVSSDGLTWRLLGQSVIGPASPLPFGLFASGVASDGRAYLAVGDQFGQIERSTDALNWTALASSPSVGAVNGVAAGKGRFVVVGRFGEIFTTP